MILETIYQSHTYIFLFDFSGQKTLLSCLYDFLKQEKLEGDNQYYCNGCESKQDATRCVRLSQLPPVRFLNFYAKFTQGDWTQIFPTIPIGLPYEDGLRTVMGVKN